MRTCRRLGLVAALALLATAVIAPAGKAKAAAGKKAKEQQKPADDGHPSGIPLKEPRRMTKDSRSPKFERIEEDDVPPGMPVKKITDGDTLDLTGGKEEEMTKKLPWAVQTIFDAVMSDDPALITRAVDQYGIDINIPGPSGYTPLFQSVLSHKLNSCHTLLKKGADPRKRNRDGFNPLDAAAFGGCSKCTRMLLGVGVDPTLIHRDGFNALHRAIWGDTDGHTETVELLLETGKFSLKKPARVPEQGLVRPLDMVNENDKTERLLERWRKKEEAKKKKAKEGGGGGDGTCSSGDDEEEDGVSPGDKFMKMEKEPSAGDGGAASGGGSGVPKPGLHPTDKEGVYMKVEEEKVKGGGGQEEEDDEEDWDDDEDAHLWKSKNDK